MKNSRPFFSIIVPTLNEEHYLPKLLKCLKDQTENNFELIIVDAKSEDDTVLSAKKFLKYLPKTKIVSSDLRNVDHQKNLGASEAIGKFLVFFDADVLIPTNLLKEINRAADKDAQFITTWVNSDSHNISDQEIANIYNVAIELGGVTGLSGIQGFNIIINREIFWEVGGLNSKIKVGTEHDLALRISKAGYKLKILKRPRLVMSLRRFRKEGTLITLRKHAIASARVLLKDPILVNDNFDYKYGSLWNDLDLRKSSPQIRTRLRRYLHLFKI